MFIFNGRKHKRLKSDNSSFGLDSNNNLFILNYPNVDEHFSKNYHELNRESYRTQLLTPKGWNFMQILITYPYLKITR